MNMNHCDRCGFACIEELNPLFDWKLCDQCMSDMKQFIRKKVRPGSPRSKKVIDWGKVKALRAAGWKLKDIAEEVGTTEATIKAQIYYR